MSLFTYTIQLLAHSTILRPILLDYGDCSVSFSNCGSICTGGLGYCTRWARKNCNDGVSSEPMTVKCALFINHGEYVRKVLMFRKYNVALSQAPMWLARWCCLAGGPYSGELSIRYVWQVKYQICSFKAQFCKRIIIPGHRTQHVPVSLCADSIEASFKHSSAVCETRGPRLRSCLPVALIAPGDNSRTTKYTR